MTAFSLASDPFRSWTSSLTGLDTSVLRSGSYATSRKPVRWSCVKVLGGFGTRGKPGPRPLTWPLAPPRPCQVIEVSAQQCRPYGALIVASFQVKEWKGPSLEALTAAKQASAVSNSPMNLIVPCVTFVGDGSRL